MEKKHLTFDLHHFSLLFRKNHFISLKLNPTFCVLIWRKIFALEFSAENLKSFRKSKFIQQKNSNKNQIHDKSFDMIKKLQKELFSSILECYLAWYRCSIFSSKIKQELRRKDKEKEFESRRECRKKIADRKMMLRLSSLRIRWVSRVCTKTSHRSVEWHSRVGECRDVINATPTRLIGSIMKYRVE